MSDKDGRLFRFTDKECANEAFFAGEDGFEDKHSKIYDDEGYEETTPARGMNPIAWTFLAAVLGGAAIGGAYLLDYF